MPIPSSSMGACLRFIRKEHPEWSRDKKIAVCLDVTKKGKKTDK